jgi:hypothetical protein
MADTTKKDPTVTSRSAKPAEEGGQPHPARPINEADDYAGDRKYEDNPDKPAPDSVAQIEVPPTEGAFADKGEGDK